MDNNSLTREQAQELLPRYQVNLKGLIRDSRIREIADDTRPARAPYVGIPVVLESGARFCIVVPRKLLEAGIVHAESVRWDADAQRLVLNGGKRSCYQLMTQDAYKVRGALEVWARGQRKRTKAKSATPGERKAAKFDAEIASLQRRKAKVYAQRPVNPLCQPPDDWRNGESWRASEARWYQGKHVRQELSRVFTGPCVRDLKEAYRPHWKQVYADAAHVLGLEKIDDGRKHSRETNRRHGPSLDEYVRHPERFLAYQSKPYRDADREFNVERMREARKNYLEQLSVIRAIEQEIRNLERLKRAALRRAEPELLAA